MHGSQYGSLCIIGVGYTNTTDGYNILEQITSPDIREYAEYQIDRREDDECLKMTSGIHSGA